MRLFNSLRNHSAIRCFCLIFLSAAASQATFAQSGNTISGYVFGYQQKPIPDVDVELTDDFSRSIGRVRTNSSGRYEFNRVSSGKFRVKVLPYTTNYEEQSQEVEIVNFSRQSSSGALTRSGFDNTTADFNLRLKKGLTAAVSNTVVFAQEIPKEAKAKYETGIANISLNKMQEGLSDVKSAIEIFPNYFNALDLLGNEYIKLKYFEAAGIILSKAVEVNPKSYRSWYGMAYAKYSLNQNAESFTCVNKALELTPVAVESLLLKGILLKKDKKYAESLVELKKAKEIAKGSVPEINWQMALLYGNNLNLYDKAAEELELFLKEQPDTKNAEMVKKLIASFKEKATK